MAQESRDEFDQEYVQLLELLDNFECLPPDQQVNVIIRIARGLAREGAPAEAIEHLERLARWLKQKAKERELIQ